MAPTEIMMTNEEILEAHIIASPDLWAEAHLNNPMDPDQPLVLRDYQNTILRDRHQRKLLRLGRRCVAAGDLIYTSEGPIPVEELMDRQNELTIFTVDTDSYKIYPTSNYEVWYNAKVKTIEITTVTGKSQRVSEDHPFLVFTHNGPEWIEAQNITNDMRLAVPRKLHNGTKLEVDSGYQDRTWITRAPKEAGQYLKDYIAQTGQSVSAYVTKAGLPGSYRLRSYPQATYKISAIARIHEDTKHIATALNADLLWEPIKEIKHHSDKIDTYDLHVPGTECFIGNGIVQHNTGKSVYLAIEGLWKAFTKSNRQVLFTAAYETQIDNIFDLIRRMAFDSKDISVSIERYRRKPYELWFKNGSVIRGLVANSSIRGKCLAKGTKVWMKDGSYKSIEDIEVGEQVISYDVERQGPVAAEVTNTFENGIKDVYELRTTSARRLILTDNHPLFVLRTKQWVHVSDIKHIAAHGADADFIAVLDNVGNLNWARVHSIKYFGKLPTFDIEVKDYHHFASFYPNTIEESGYSVSGTYSGGILTHNSADDLIIDEGDYIPQKTMLEDIWPIATTYAHTTVVFSSTPTGRREFFWNISVNKNKPEFNFHEYHIPSSRSPEWTPEQESLVRAITTSIQYSHEYDAEFGEALEGVFRNRDIDAGLFVYDYKDLKRNKDNYYVLGVDWNEPKNGVQIVVLEFLNKPVRAVKYNNGEYVLTEREKHVNVFRVFRVEEIDALEYINTTAVDKILKLMMEIKPDFCAFDHGHGHTNWELLRLGIKKKRTSTGMKVHGLDYALDKMMVVDFGGITESIDPITGNTEKHSTKNFMVNLTQSTFELNKIMIPACNKKGEPIEDNEGALVQQLRDYSIKRRGQRGDVYEAGKAGDHRLDALMLALYAYGQEHNDFMHYNFDSSPVVLENNLFPEYGTTRMGTTRHAPNGYTYTKNGILVQDHGHWAGKGDPPERGEHAGLHPVRENRRNTGFTRRGDRSL